MAYITITNTFTSGAVAASGQVNQNFTDITAGLSDGTKDVHVRDISVTSAIVTGWATIGRATFHDLLGADACLQVGGNGILFSQVGESTANKICIAMNAYNDGNWRYMTTDGKVSIYQQDAGTHYFYAAASGTALGGITNSEILRLSKTEANFSTTSISGAFKVDYANSKLFSSLLKTTQATAASVAALYVNLSTGEIFSTALD